MTEWLSANWIWILLALGVGWFLLRRGGACCGMGGYAHRYRHDPAPGAEELDRGDHEEPSMTTKAGAAGGSRHRGGCC
jgi:hypothetical protein